MASESLLSCISPFLRSFNVIYLGGNRKLYTTLYWPLIVTFALSLTVIVVGWPLTVFRKSLRLSRFKSDGDEIWHDCNSSSDYAFIHSLTQWIADADPPRAAGGSRILKRRLPVTDPWYIRTRLWTAVFAVSLSLYLFHPTWHAHVTRGDGFSLRRFFRHIFLIPDDSRPQ